jgi:hypothetical protein
MFTSRILPLLWADPQWRQRIICGSPDQARAQFQSILKSFQSSLAATSVSDFIPDGWFCPAKEVIELDSYLPSSSEILPACLIRSPIAVFIADEDSVFTVHSGINDVEKRPDFSVSIRVPSSLRPLALRLSAINPGCQWDVDLTRSDSHNLLRVLMHCGYLRAAL